MSEEIDAIAPVGASASLGSSVPAVDVRVAPRSAQRGSTMPPANPPTALAVAAQPRLAPQIEPVEESLKRINARLASANRVMQLRVDAGSGLTIAEIRNTATGEVLQQIPSSDLVQLAQMLASWAHGKNLLIDLIA